ncbi:MAG: hypothetical protein LBM67_04510 [Lentimicrobiaceae bacterium]|jgi:hypothetical protein|nr:hypothetical protein [Lentimicrobiaceae bacterium]
MFYKVHGKSSLQEFQDFLVTTLWAANYSQNFLIDLLFRFRELLEISISRLATETKAEFTNVNEHFVEEA